MGDKFFKMVQEKLALLDQVVVTLAEIKPLLHQIVDTLAEVKAEQAATRNMVSKQKDK